MRYHPFLLQGDDQAQLETAAELSQLPILWAIPDLIPAHRLTLITGPSGVGLTDLACRLLAYLAPANHFLDASLAPSPTPALSPSPSAESLSPSPTPPISPSSSPDPAFDLLPEELIPDPNDPDWDPNLPLVPDQPAKASPVGPVLPTALLITTRDEPDVLRPRLLSAGADPHRVLILSEMIVPDDDPADPTPIRRPFSLQDCNFLERLLHEHKSIRMVIIDNAEMLFTYEGRQSRSALHRRFFNLLQVARQREVAIVLMTPIPRIGANPFRSALLGALNEACRRVYLLAPDPESQDHRYLFCLKNTLPGPMPTLQIPSSVVRLTQPQSSLPPSPTPALSPSGFFPTSLTYSTYLQLIRRRPGPIPHARLQAQKFLTDLLAKGALPVGNHKDAPENSIRAQVIAAGLSWGTIRRAATEMNLRIFRDADCWYWQLPSSPTPVESVVPPAELAQPTCAPSQLSTNDQQPMTNDNKSTCAHSGPTPADAPLITIEHPQGVAA